MGLGTTGLRHTDWTRPQSLSSTAKVVRAMFQGPPPPDDLSIIVRIDRHSVKAFVQGVPVDLSGKTDLMDASGSRRAWRPHPRSVGVLVIHPTTARILRRYVHPPHARAASLRAFVEALQPGRVVLMVGVVSCE
nr:uncharacterized protein LOC113825969 [Penaeus vannamei]